ncbi:GNAT family N-acetyltransferase [Luteolibacter sp. GHJ8]|uniref:GNAT family N-acetyltransferase n=1 Tax=Luteolibacter rhizosphaerae TaxID=2989719 RepID=A0ABT3G4X3_9BACT|nr:GNAT family N-acetyltransferase [Luteolibacter rhizosphaerae]
MVRRYREGDHLEIGRIYHEAIHRLAAADYTPEQLAAWSNGKIDWEKWRERCERKQPFVKEIEGEVAGFMEMDPDGHIDCTYVNPVYARRGVMSEIMAAVKAEAERMGIKRLFAEVSITARPFFEKHGFVLVRDNQVLIGDQILINFIMESRFVSDPG